MAKTFISLFLAVLLSLVTCLPLRNLDTLDITDIEQTLNRFSLAVDTHDWTLLQSVFTEDAVGIFGAGTEEIQGLATLETALRTTLTGTLSQHALSTQTVDFTGERSAFAISYLQGTFFGTGNLTGQTYTTYGR